MLQSMLFPMTVYALMLFVPGCLVLRCTRLPWSWSLCCAPVITTALVAILGEMYALGGIAATPLTVYLPAAGVPLVALIALQLLSRTSQQGSAAPRRVDDKSDSTLPAISWWMPLLFVAFGLLICNNLFVSELPTLDAFSQEFDNQHHLNVIQGFVDAQRISSLRVSFFLSDADRAIMPYGQGTFYPAVWYGQCALLAQATGISVPASINVSLAASLGLAYPLGMCAVACTLFERHHHAAVFCALTCVGFVMFPWCLLIFGPLYPNLVGFLLLPASIALSMRAFALDLSRRERIGAWACVGGVIVGQAFVQPNTLFTLFLILVPFVTRQAYVWARARGLSKAKACGVAALFVLVCLVFWTVCVKSPFFASVIRELWPLFAYPWQEVINILTQTYTLFYFYEITAQVLMGVLVAVGFVRCAYDGELRWLVVSYLYLCFINFVCATSYNDALKRFLAGFWYTDAMRLAGMAILVAVPIAAYGLDWLYEQACGLLDSYNARLGRTTHRTLVLAVMSVCFLLLNFMPGFNWPGAHAESTNHIDEYRLAGHEYDSNSVKTTFGDYRQRIRDVYGRKLPIDEHEMDFLDEVKAIVGSDLVINNPYDGSTIAYGVKDIRVYYRKAYGQGGESETPQSLAIRTGLASIRSNDQVRQAVDEIGVRYVMVLDPLWSQDSFLHIRSSVADGAFDGIASITPDTPGFTEILASGSCHLYRID